MKGTLTEKILAEHLVNGEPTSGGQIGIRIDQTLTQDATGTTAYLLYEAMGAPRVKTDLSVSYVDHNTAQFGPENHNDHIYLQSIATKVGAYHSRPGNGICHQVHLERFARPGATLLGSDSHTPTAGGMGSFAVGAGGLDVAAAMAGEPFYLACPKVIGVELTGELPAWVSAKDIILRLLSILTTRGNVGCVVEYHGVGVATLDVPSRATCTNMGAELGVTTSIFPADDATRKFLAAQQRQDAFRPLAADEGAEYSRITKRLHAKNDAGALENIRKFCRDVEITDADEDGFVEVSFSKVVIDLPQLTPLAAAPSSPENVVEVNEASGKKVRQVLIGSCTNSSYKDLMLTAAMLKGKTVHPDVELGIAPGSRQVLETIAANGALAEMVRAGARILESACGPCIGLGFSPAEGAVSMRTFNRNFPGRSGTKGDRVYLVSPATAAASALAGEITDPRKIADEQGIECPQTDLPDHFEIDDNLIVPPVSEDRADSVEITRAETIVPPPKPDKFADKVRGPVLIKVGDKITTDHIMPAGALLKYRSNVPQYARYVFDCFNEDGQPTFADRAMEAKNASKAGVIVAGESYGQGSSREHAALCPMYLGVKVVIAKTIERIHKANLINFGIWPLTFAAAGDYDKIERDDELIIADVAGGLESGRAKVRNATKDFEFTCISQLSERERKMLAAGGRLNYATAGNK